MTVKQRIARQKENKSTYTLVDYVLTKAKTDRGLTIALYNHFKKNGYDYDEEMNIQEKIETFKQGVKEGFYKECKNGIVIFADEGGKGGVSIEYTK